MSSVRRPKLVTLCLICCKGSDRVVTVWFLPSQIMVCCHIYNYDCDLSCDSRSLKSCLQRRHQGLRSVLSPDRGERDLSIDVSVCVSRWKWRRWDQGRQGGKRAEHSLTLNPEFCWLEFSSYVNMNIITCWTCCSVIILSQGGWKKSISFSVFFSQITIVDHELLYHLLARSRWFRRASIREHCSVGLKNGL